VTTTVEHPEWTTGTALRELVRLALPIVAMTVSRMLMTFVDFVMVSQLGTEAQAAISPATMFVFVLGCLGLGIATATQTFVAQAVGRGQPRAAGGYAWQSLYIALALGLITAPLAATTATWFTPLTQLGQHSPGMVEMEVAYVRIALWSLVPSVLCIGLEGFFNGIQRPRIALVAILAALVVNVAGNWLFIFGHLGCPRMGVAGAALATVIGWLVRVGVLVVAILHRETDTQFGTRHSLGLRWEKLAGLLRIGGPTGVQWLVDIGSWAVFLLLIVPPLGVNTTAASNVGLQLMHLSFMPAIGVGIALCSQVGFAIGAGRPEEAMWRARIALALNMIYMGAVGLLFLLAREPLIAIFNTDPLVIRAGGHVLIWAAVFQIFDAMGITYMNALRGAGDTRFMAILMAVCCWGIFVAGGYATVALAPGWGLNGPWSMCTLYIIVVGVVLWWRWHGQRWRAIRLFQDHGPVAGNEPAAKTAAVATSPAAGGP